MDLSPFSVPFSASLVSDAEQKHGKWSWIKLEVSEQTPAERTTETLQEEFLNWTRDWGPDSSVSFQCLKV